MGLESGDGDSYGVGFSVGDGYGDSLVTAAAVARGRAQEGAVARYLKF